MTTKTSVYEEVTARIIDQLENGVAPWRKSWSSGGSALPRNVAGRHYRGVNVLLLWAAAEARGFDSSIWGTFNQWRHLGGHVNRGEKGTKIVYWNVTEKSETDPATGEDSEDRRFFLRVFTVFNVSQCGGESLERFRPKKVDRQFVNFAPADEAIAATHADIRFGGGSAYYLPSDDFIQLPPKPAFDSEAAYYSTALHELVHWSGHESRLNRLEKLARFNKQAYAAEELVAELGSAFLAASLGIPNAPIQDNASYLKHWLAVLKSDSRAIFTASTAASKAADFVHSFSRKVEADKAEEELVTA